MSTPLKISQLLALADGAWVNDGFEGVVLSIVPKEYTPKGAQPGAPKKKMFICKFGELAGGAEVECTVFTFPKFAVGDCVTASGQGIKFKNGQYGPQVSIGDKAAIAVTGKSAHHTEQVEHRAHSEPAANGATFTVNGSTVGMAMKEAIALLTRELGHDDLIESLCTPTFWQAVHETSSDIIRCARLLEAGKLAPSVKVRRDGPTPVKPAAPPPSREYNANPPGRPGGSTAKSEAALANQTNPDGSPLVEEDVPF